MGAATETNATAVTLPCERDCAGVVNKRHRVCPECRRLRTSCKRMADNRVATRRFRGMWRDELHDIRAGRESRELEKRRDAKARPSTADERPTAQKADCLWLLFFNPDQVHRAPSQGPLIGGRTSDESSSAARIGQIGQLGREP